MKQKKICIHAHTSLPANGETDSVTQKYSHNELTAMCKYFFIFASKYSFFPSSLNMRILSVCSAVHIRHNFSKFGAVPIFPLFHPSSIS